MPYRHVRQEVDVRLTDATVEVFFQGRRLASHVRSFRRGHHTTVRARMLPSHRHASGWTPERIIRWAAKTGPATARLIARVIEARTHPRQGTAALSAFFDSTNRKGASARRDLVLARPARLDDHGDAASVKTYCETSAGDVFERVPRRSAVDRPLAVL